MSESLRPPKTCWHPLSLQQLATHRFVGVVNRILSGRNILVDYTLRRPRHTSAGPAANGTGDDA